MTFESLNVKQELVKGLNEIGVKEPTEIQEQAIPQLISGVKDFIGLAHTGTGKTAAFGLPLLELIDPYDKNTQALVLAPTRELGQQIAEQLATYSKYLDQINVLAIYGGARISNQIKALKKTQHIIIATPGRLIDLIKRKAVKLDQLQYLVLDEADEMLNMGFKEELDKILSYTPDDKLTWLFAATMPKEIRRIVDKYMDDPVEIKVNPENEINTNIEHQYTVVRRDDKAEALTRFLDSIPDMHGIVFCRTKRDTQKLAELLMKKKYMADAIHGDLSQTQRDRVMRRFKAHDLKVLVATDVAARGIDVHDLSHVFHFTLPDDTSYYTHRSGRTARAGKTGISIAFINGRELTKIKGFERQLRISFEKISVPENDAIADIRIENWCRQILEQKTKAKIDPQLIDKVNILFGDLSKEELIEKLLINETDKLNIDGSKDLNDRQNSNSTDGRDNRKSDSWDREKTSRRDSRRTDSRDNKRKDIREATKGRNRDGSREERKGIRSQLDNGNPRFFINLGSRDKISKQDLNEFVCRIAKIDYAEIGEIELQRSCSFFEVDTAVEKQIASSFVGIELEDGRTLRVNRDN
ncbi:MAG: DEAD/DEAH box helicase [Bacteroidetes bacterium]|nr:DEAD/DEAH box helicase [Bacteroidota bacterium]